MAVVEEVIRAESDGSLSFGNFKLDEKKKVSDFEHLGDTYKVKTYKDITKLEKNEAFVYESVPGTAVFNFRETEEGVIFDVDAIEDAQITIGLEENARYAVIIDGEYAESITTGVGGKLSLNFASVEDEMTNIEIKKLN